MTDVQKEQLIDAWEYCDREDKSTGFMIQYMMDVSGLSHDAVVDFLVQQSEKESE